MATSTTSTASSSSSSTRSLKRSSIERPRPLKIQTTTTTTTTNSLPTSNSSANNRLSSFELSSVENTLSLLENVSRNLANGNYDPTVLTAIVNMSASLKSWGPRLETMYKDQLDKLQVALRNACRDERLNFVTRLHLLEIIELRAMNWVHNESVTNYYNQKRAQVEEQEARLASGSMSAPVSNASFFPTPSLAPGEILHSSGKFPKPVKIQGKNTFKDEVVIRNADSGKVMGLKGRRVHVIEEMSDTIISFQRVAPGAKDRLVQITGPGADNIEQAKSLMEDTIKRNHSPQRDSNMNVVISNDDHDDGTHEYKYTVNVGAKETIKICGSNLDLVKAAKIALDEYFTQRESLEDQQQHNKVGYTKVDVVRYPLFPSSSKQAFDVVEQSSRPFDTESKQRRASFAKTAAAVASASSNSKTPVQSPAITRKKAPLLRYDRKKLLELADTEVSRNLPMDWERIREEFPTVALKVCHDTPLPLDWEANFLFSKKSKYSQHCDREEKEHQRLGHDSRA